MNRKLPGDSRELNAILENALQACDQETRSALLLYCLEGFSFADISALTGFSIEQVEHQFLKGLAILSGRFLREGRLLSKLAIIGLLQNQEWLSAPASIRHSFARAFNPDSVEFLN
jgi:hypothetical protein